MRNLNEGFERQSREFDRNFAQARKWGIILSVLGVIISLASMGFIVWVIIVLLQFFGVV